MMFRNIVDVDCITHNPILPGALCEEASYFTSVFSSASLSLLTEEPVLRDTVNHLLKYSDTYLRLHQTLPGNGALKSAH